jgi:hypothetical protein
MKTWWKRIYGLAIALTIFLGFFIKPEHQVFPWHRVLSLDAIFGLLGALVLLGAVKLVGAINHREEDFYD